MSHFCFAGADTNIIAVSDWSKSVSTGYGQSLRGRMLIAEEQPPGHASPETELFLELENVSDPVAGPMQVYVDPANGLHCGMLDAYGKPPTTLKVSGGMRGDGGGYRVPVNWITLPYDSTIRLRANGTFSWRRGDGLLLMLDPFSDQHWEIGSGDTNTYFLYGTFTVTPPTNQVQPDATGSRAQWQGTLDLPKMKISLRKP